MLRMPSGSCSAAARSQTPPHRTPNIPDTPILAQRQRRRQTLALLVLLTPQTIRLGEEIPHLGDVPSRAARHVAQQTSAHVHLVGVGVVARLGRGPRRSTRGEVDPTHVNGGRDVVGGHEERFLERLDRLSVVVQRMVIQSKLTQRVIGIGSTRMAVRT